MSENGDSLDKLINSNERLSGVVDQLLKTPGTLSFQSKELQGYNQQFSPEVVSMAQSILSRRELQGLLGQSHAGERDIYLVCGYRKDLEYEHYKARYDRQDIAGRIVDSPAAASWRRHPDVLEIQPQPSAVESPGDSTESEVVPSRFEEVWKHLVEKLKVYHYCERADRLSGIGEYGVLFIGLGGGTDLSTPISQGQITDPAAIVYLSAYDQGSAQIESYVTDVTDPRFGEPEMYKLDLLGDLVSNTISGTGRSREAERWKKVHWTRVIHVAENKTSNEVLGRPRLQRIYNRLMDLEKVVGGSGEMWWQGARLGLHVDVDPSFALGDLSGAMGQSSAFSALEAELDKYFHGLTRFIRTKGVKITNLGVQVANPEPHARMLLSIISGATGIPMRILLGSERGELASSQDDANWNARIVERRTTFAQPDILEPLIKRLQYFGVLPETPHGFEVIWPSLFELSVDDAADVAWKKSRALKDYSESETAQKMVDVDEFRAWVDLPPMTEEQKARLAGDLGLGEMPLDELPLGEIGLPEEEPEEDEFE